MNRQQIQNALTTQNSVAVYIKDMKTEETFSSQYQMLVETTKLWQQLFFGQKFTTAQIGFCNDH